MCIYAARGDFWDLLGGALARHDPGPAVPLRLCYDAFTHPERTYSTLHAGVDRAFAALPAVTAPAGSSRWRSRPCGSTCWATTATPARS
ncbi:hypothetical protein [Dactylosporangium darangshiense]|uniref:hypothetical protein n=1 Tax=Dactylosporangium darangshiense TaxID=579108 RepID=UPI00362ADEDF